MLESAFMHATGLVLDEVSGSRVVGHLDLGPEHHTPFGIVHGGVYCAAVETAASVGATTAVQDRGQFAAGLTNTTQFLRSTPGGRATLEAVAVHQGRTQQLWQVEIRDGGGRLLARGELRLQNLPVERDAASAG
jgi:1,4-dihydroxy-2-naphthoyl-CoA hydrolase